jgi:anthranilate synthase component 1
MTTKEEYINYANSAYSIVPLTREIDNVEDSPISLYLKVSAQQNTFLLESIEGGDKWAQYSIIGFGCKDSIKISGNQVETNINGVIDSFYSEDPLSSIQEITSQDSAPELDGMPRFYGGYVGFFAYESAQYAEARIADLTAKNSKFKDHMPEIFLIKAERLIVYDNFSNSTKIIFNANPQKLSYEESQDELDKIQSLINKSIEIPDDNFNNPTGDLEFKSNFSKADYLQSVEVVKSYIQDGDVMQVVLAQDFSSDFLGDPFVLYRAIRKLNPSPYLYFLDFEDYQVVGSSPEILIRLEDEELTLRPLAGTRKRGSSDEEDNLNEKDLLNDPKEIAEHLMLIDLGRNDVGKVSKIGSVKVTDKMIIEKYSHVMHIVSNVVGSINSNLNYIDALKASLPAGTLSGAPKIRAMEIIHELEPSSRGIYGGAIGYISWNGNIDTAIAIRTAVIKDNIIHVGAGAGIVADSVPENEWLECKQKSKAFVDAMEMIL